jgi:hypothetical protein
MHPDELDRSTTAARCCSLRRLLATGSTANHQSIVVEHRSAFEHERYEIACNPGATNNTKPAHGPHAAPRAAQRPGFDLQRRAEIDLIAAGGFD